MPPEVEARFIPGPSAWVLAAGAACTVYTDGQRVPSRATSPEARLFSQAAIMRALALAGVPVPEVLEVDRLPDGRTFSLETFVVGDGTCGRSRLRDL